MDNHDRNIQQSRQNWQSVEKNAVASPGYYDKCEELLKNFAGRHLDGGMTILDLGCGDGRFTETMVQFCKSAVGYEFSAAMLEKARELRASEKLAFFPIDLEKRDWTLPSAQLAMCMGVLTYIHEDSQMEYILDKVRNSLAEGGGSIFITRESLSKKDTFRWMTQGKYYSIYRSYADYYNLFIKNGFEFVNEIKLFEDDYVINAFRLWQRKSL